MKITDETLTIFADLEYLVGKECFNPKSYDGYRNIQGKSFRYPVTIPYKADGEGEEEKFCERLNSLSWITPYHIEKSKYKFGSNHLYIGKALENVLTFLEERYEIDFTELERALKSEQKGDNYA